MSQGFVDGVGSHKPLSVLHVVPGLDPAHGGPSYSVPRLCTALVESGLDVELLSVLTNGASSLSNEAVFRFREFPHLGAGVAVLGGLRLSRQMAAALRVGSQAADVIHNHGVWLAPNMQAQFAAARAGKPFVSSPRGMLSPEALSISKLKKRAMWALRQGSALRATTAFHATSEQELAEIRALGLRAPVAVIPNGVDVAPERARPTAPGGLKTVLALGRIHPKKGLPGLLRAWSEVEADHADWRLRIVGPAEIGHDQELLALAGELGLQRVSIEPPVYGVDKQTLYQDADLFVLSTKNENFGLTVAESLAAGTPVVCTTGAPWAGLEREACGWWVDQGADALAVGLKDAMATPADRLAAMGARGRAWMMRDYSWMRVAEDMSALYTWLKSGGDRPQFVSLD